MSNCNPVARKAPYLCSRTIKKYPICTNTNIIIMSTIMNIIMNMDWSTAGC